MGDDAVGWAHSADQLSSDSINQDCTLKPWPSQTPLQLRRARNGLSSHQSLFAVKGDNQLSLEPATHRRQQDCSHRNKDAAPCKREDQQHSRQGKSRETLL